MAKKNEKRGLGRGLSALMADINETEVEISPSVENSGSSERLVPITKVHANPDQPRRTFDHVELRDLAKSILAKGIIQPLIVRPDPVKTGEFQIVAGERRWRAAQTAKVDNVPVVIREMDDLEVLEIAIIENIQRADLNAIEEAAGYRDLMSRFGHTQEKVSEALGKSRSHIANLLRLLNLPDDVQEFVRDGKLTAGHARTLVTSENAVELAKQIIAKGLSVREAERLAKKPTDAPKDTPKAKAEKDADTKALEGDLSATLGMKVSIDHKAGGESGSVTISYETLDQLDEICNILSK